MTKLCIVELQGYKKCSSDHWKKSNPFFFPAATNTFLALEGAKCCDTE